MSCLDDFANAKSSGDDKNHESSIMKSSTFTVNQKDYSLQEFEQH